MPIIVITCESCGAQFRLDSARLTKPENKVRCTKCRHVFLVERPDEDALIYIEVSTGEDGFIPGSIPQPAASTPAVPKSRFTGRIALLAALPILALIAIALYFNSQNSLLNGSAEKPVPKEPIQPTVTILDTVQAFYLENVHAGQVLVIEGEVLNESSKPVSFVLIEGKLFANNEKVAQVQRCFSGNSLTRKDISNLKLAEIQERMMNREGKNLKNVRIPPAAKVPFVLVFHNLPEINTLSNYTVDVISSKFD